MRVADFFCGGGGFSEGFRQAGYQIVFAVDKWEPAIKTYKGNKPGVCAIVDDVIRISRLNDEDFEATVPDSEVIIGSPPCQAFSHSNKSGNGDKALGIKMIEAYLRIIARKKFKKNSILRYWVLENVPNVEKYIKEEYTALELELEGDCVLKTRGQGTGIYNAKYFGAPTSRKRYLCGEFPKLSETHTDENVVTLRNVLDSLGLPLEESSKKITDVNYPDLSLFQNDISDHKYIYKLAPFEWKAAKRLKQDKGYMGKMSFPENLDKPARTVMATMTSSSREAMILEYGNNKYRLPTVREAATMMSFPMDYRFYGRSKGIKHTLVGNAVPPKLSYAVAKAIALDAGEKLPEKYIPIHHDESIPFLNLNGTEFPLNREKPRRAIAKFKYHIPYLIYSSYRVELTNYHSNFSDKNFQWNAEIHYSQGEKKAAVYNLSITLNQIEEKYHDSILEYLKCAEIKFVSYNMFQEIYCMTSEERLSKRVKGPYELLEELKQYINVLIPASEQSEMIEICEEPKKLPKAIIIGYYLLQQLMNAMGGITDGCQHKEAEA